MQPPIWEQWPSFFRGADRALTRIAGREAWVDRMVRWDMCDGDPDGGETPRPLFENTAAWRPTFHAR